LAAADLDEMSKLAPHDFPSTDHLAQGAFAEDGPQLKRLVTGKDLLAGQPSLDKLVLLLVALLDQAGRGDGLSIGLRLEQAGYELGFVRPASHRAGFQADVVLVGVGQDVAVRLPPAGLVGLAGDGDQSIPAAV
jgi:hypothetical protein